ncbi:hypothetical protein LTS18_006231 [Coniosporium uncinatum]|uniref:Uncharacterized protein n=1 Tax=Coniosporium uncinatum TaxID=93489 RepID=A0ACC3DZL8_9PEZI|nr:hypothetical protein LTS18_006231 [Coniosporium uncinatum]
MLPLLRATIPLAALLTLALYAMITHELSRAGGKTIRFDGQTQQHGVVRDHNNTPFKGSGDYVRMVLCKTRPAGFTKYKDIPTGPVTGHLSTVSVTPMLTAAPRQGAHSDMIAARTTWVVLWRVVELHIGDAICDRRSLSKEQFPGFCVNSFGG